MTKIPMSETKSEKKYDLEERTSKFAKRVIALCRQLEKHVINRELIGQLVRSAGSVGANYREANEALSRKDFSYRVKICRKEAKESSYWLDLLREANEEYRREIEDLFQESVELRKIFSSIAEKAK
jgi:four helix bundle protein